MSVRPRTDLPLAAFHDDELLLRGGPGEHDLRVVLEDVIQLLGGHVLQVGPVHHAGLGVPGIGTGGKVTRHFSPGGRTPRERRRAGERPVLRKLLSARYLVGYRALSFYHFPQGRPVTSLSP